MAGRLSGAAEDDAPMAELNMVPLIDIALTLVVILMVTSAFIRQPGVSLKLPETKTREGSPENNRDVVVAVAANGALFVDGAATDPAQLSARLRAVAARNREARVLIKGDRDAAYSRIMDVMDLVRQAGLTRVVLPTRPKE